MTQVEALRASVPAPPDPMANPDPGGASQVAPEGNGGPGYRHVVLPGFCSARNARVVPHLPIGHRYSIGLWVRLFDSTDRGTSNETGCLWRKGGGNFLTVEEKESPWSSFELGLVDSKLVYQCQEGKQAFKVQGNTRIEVDKWTYVAVVQSGSSVNLWVHGEKDAHALLPTVCCEPEPPVPDASIVKDLQAYMISEKEAKQVPQPTSTAHRVPNISHRSPATPSPFHQQSIIDQNISIHQHHDPPPLPTLRRHSPLITQACRRP